MKEKFYAGIGSRETPDEILNKMKTIASLLEETGWTLRSGGALGADSAFESGVSDKKNKQIFLPWRKYNNRISQHNFVPDWALKIAEEFHPFWDGMKQGAQKLHGRNTQILLGPLESSDPVYFIVCWTKDGKDIGGTGQALRLAKAAKIPIYNLYFEEHEKRLSQKISEAYRKNG